MADAIEDHLVLEFLDVRIDIIGRELWRAGESVRVEPQVFDLLVYLIRHRDRVVSKIDLYDAIWEHRFVSEWP